MRLQARVAVYAALFFPLLAATLPGQQSQARIRIDTSRVIGEVHPHIFGNFAEHFGRCIYGGIFEEGSPLSDSEGFGKVDVSSTYNTADRTLYLNVLNRSETLDITARLDNVAGELGTEAAVWEMNHPDLKAVNDFGSEKVRPAVRNATLAADGNAFSNLFPKHSLTILKLKLR